MSSNFTPAPWRADDYRVLDANGYQLGDFLGVNTRSTEDKANARLAGCAPDLLDLLKRLRAAAGGWIEGRGDEADALLDDVDVAILEAEGGP